MLYCGARDKAGRAGVSPGCLADAYFDNMSARRTENTTLADFNVGQT